MTTSKKLAALIGSMLLGGVVAVSPLASAPPAQAASCAILHGGANEGSYTWNRAKTDDGNPATTNCSSAQSRVARYITTSPTFRVGPVSSNSYVSLSGGIDAGKWARGYTGSAWSAYIASPNV